MLTNCRAQRENYQDSERKTANERHSQTVDPERETGQDSEKSSEHVALTNCKAQRDRQVRTGKNASERGALTLF
jgi:hypothetical protein